MSNFSKIDFSLFDYVPYGVFILDVHFNIIFWNNALTQFSTLEKESVLNKNIFQQFKNLNTPLYKKRFELLFESKTPMVLSAQLHRYLIPCPLPDGEYRIHQVFANVLEKNNQSFAVFTLQDLTEEEKKAVRYKKLKNQAEKIAQLRADYLSVVSHEIRNPLNAIIGISNILLQEPKMESQSKNLKSLNNAAEYLLLLVNDVLEHGRIEAGNIAIVKDFFDVYKLVENIKNIFTPKAVNKQLNFLIEIAENIPLIECDSLRLSQILSNLISNAIKFTNEGEVKLVVSLLEKKEDHINLSFKVVDSGIGISEADKKNLFKNFSQANLRIAKRFGGSGLGLSISKKLLEMLGSEIQLESESGKGSTFSFNLKVRCKEEGEVKELEEKVIFEHNENVHLNILLAEDSEINQMMVEQFLAKWGFSITSCLDGAIALKEFSKNPEHYDLILTDLQMPNMNGYETTEAIRKLKNDWAKKIPIIAITASDLETNNSSKAKAIFTDFIIKPFQPEQLYQKIMKYHTYSNSFARGQSDIDFSHYVEIANADYEFLTNLLSKILEEFDKFSEEYLLYVSNGNLEELRKLHHRLKPTFKLLHLEQLSKIINEGKDLLRIKEISFEQKKQHLEEFDQVLKSVLLDVKIKLNELKHL